MITLIPYLRGRAHRDMLYRIWAIIEENHDWRNIYWDDTDTPEFMLGDLPHFVFNMHSPDDPKLTFICVDDDGVVCGMVWFNKLDGVQCEGNIWIARGWRHLARVVVKDATDQIFRLGYKVVHGTTPHTNVRNLLVKSGYEDLGQILGKVWCLRMENKDGQIRESQSTNDPNVAG